MNIPKNLFNLKPDQEETSKMMYDGKIIKCLVAPYHTYSELEKAITYAPNIFLYPEKELPIQHLKSFITIAVKSKLDEILIITANQNIIMDMVDACVRVLTQDGRIVDCPIKTFMANIHDIRYSLLENEDHQLSKEKQEKGKEIVNDIITEINSLKTVTKDQRKKLEFRIDMIGEELISNILKSKLRDIPVV
jgi:hypothetical protein